MHPVFDLPPERTEYADEAYAVVGRALTYASMFERDCKLLNSLFGLKSSPMESSKAFDSFAGRLSSSLKSHEDEMIQYLEAPELRSILSDARKQRNWLAHEATIGLQTRIDGDDERQATLQEIEGAINQIARAHLAVLVIMCRQTNEEIPSVAFLTAFAPRVLKWVCEV